MCSVQRAGSEAWKHFLWRALNSGRKHSQKHGRHRPTFQQADTHTRLFFCLCEDLLALIPRTSNTRLVLKHRTRKLVILTYCNSSSHKATLEVRARTSGQTNYQIITAREKTPTDATGQTYYKSQYICSFLNILVLHLGIFHFCGYFRSTI